MPERVLPEPVSPVMSQPRQKSARVHLKPASLTTTVDSIRAATWQENRIANAASQSVAAIA